MRAIVYLLSLCLVLSAHAARRDCGLSGKVWRDVALPELAQAKEELGLAPVYRWFLQNPGAIPRGRLFQIRALESRGAFAELTPLLVQDLFKSQGLNFADFEVATPDMASTRIPGICHELLATLGGNAVVRKAQTAMSATLASSFDPEVMDSGSFQLFVSKPSASPALVLLSVGYNGEKAAEPPMTAALVLNVRQ